MDERKILLLIFSVVIYCLYCAHMWFTSDASLPENTEIEETVTPLPQIEKEVIHANVTETKQQVEVKAKPIPTFLKNACSVLQVFTEKPPVKCKDKSNDMEADANTITVIGIAVLLIGLTVNAVLDVLKVKEEERARRKLNPDGERRQSLAEFANKKTIRRESSKFGLQLFQIAESISNSEDDKKNRRQSKPYTRGDSINSYLSDRKVHTEGSVPASVGDTSEPKLVKRSSVAKLFGGRPARMVRRSSFPALPINPDIQAMMLGHRQPSVDSDDESDKRGHRVRILRRF